ncbi:MAG: hypothetical protein ACE5IH_10475, partial [Thermodesulfobacteriota bacterium]
ISALLMKLINTAKRFNMSLHPDLLLLQRSMVIVEGVGRQLYPDVDPWEIARPMIYRWMIREKASPERFVKKGRDTIEEMSGFALDMPGQVHEIFKRTLAEELRIGFVHYGLKGLIGEISGLGTKIFTGMVVAALLLSSTMFLILGDKEVGAWWLQALGGVGYSIGLIILVVLVIRVFRKRQPWL